MNGRQRRLAVWSIGATLLMAFVGGGLVAQPASASVASGSGAGINAASSGGDGDPIGCAAPVTYASAPIYGSRGALSGVQIGVLQLRWSWSCYANWSRVVLYSRLNPDKVTIEEFVQVEGRETSSSAFMVDTYAQGATKWTPYLRVSSSNSVTCAQVYVSSNFGTLNFHTNGASVCA